MMSLPKTSMPRPLTLLLVIASIVAAQPPVYKVGDRVEANDVGWYKGVIVQIGSGNYQGYYLVKYDEFSSQRYFKPDSLRPAGPPEKPRTYPVYNLGDRVEGYDFGWHPARITEIRAGKDALEYLLKYERFSSSRWYHPRDMRAAGAGDNAKAQDQAAAAQGPRTGKYGIYSYGAVAAQPLYLGHFEILAGSRYRVSRTSGPPYFGEGTYRFNSANSTVEWLTGPYASPEWGGQFSVEAGRHRIALRARTIATNSP
jgi:hypothetical protein